MITAKDIKTLEKTFVTKLDLREALRELKSVFVSKEEFKEALTQLKSDIFDKIDSLIKEVRDSHEERQIIAGQISELYDRVEKLESPGH